jgi:hypothetical protein
VTKHTSDCTAEYAEHHKRDASPEQRQDDVSKEGYPTASHRPCQGEFEIPPRVGASAIYKRSSEDTDQVPEKTKQWKQPESQGASDGHEKRNQETAGGHER